MKNGIKLAALVALALGLVLPTTGFAQKSAEKSSIETSSTTAHGGKTEFKEKKSVKHKHGKTVKKEKKEEIEKAPTGDVNAPK